ncbi:hypothetical protein FACS1894216_17470 [Synergistales bacterium]|nr:hypothetical protein FACS1894216_17470 [Synergistales bacterium]
MNCDAKITAIILAAGLSSRMGACKALLPLGGVSALEFITTRMRDAGVSGITVVTGRYADAVRAEALRLGCNPAHNPLYETGMYSSVLAGVRALPEDADAFFILPCDIPLVTASTYVSLTDAFRERRGASAVYPVYEGERGHPPLLSVRLRESVLSWGGEGGLRGLLESAERDGEDGAMFAEVPVDDMGTALDMDTMEDYKKIAETLRAASPL